MKAPHILKSTTIKTKQRLMYYLGAFNFMYAYTVLAYAMAVFLIERFSGNENAIFYVGVILAIANIFGLFVNGIWLYMQKTLKPKTLILIAIIGLMISVGIFLGSQIFLSTLALPAFTILAAFFYIWAFDLYDITMNTLIMNKTEEKNQGVEFSQKKIAESVGMLFGIITGGVFLYFGSLIAQFFLMVFLFIIFLYFKSHFENEKDKIDLVFSDEKGIEWKKVIQVISHPDKVKTKLSKADKPLQEKILKVSKALNAQIQKEIKNLPDTTVTSLKKASKKSKSLLNEARLFVLDILAKENEVKRKAVPKHDFHMKEILSEISISFNVLAGAFSFSSRYAFFWASGMVMFFSFWDTMAITYQPIFLERFKENLGLFTVIIMPLFILPVFVFQIPFGKMADKYGNHIMMLAGLFVSALSLIILGTLDVFWGGSVTILILSGMGNSIGYAAAFSASQVKFTKEVAYYLRQENKKGKVKNSTKAASLRLTLNIGNILGQLFGGIIFALLGFLFGFLVLGVFLLFFFFITLVFYKELELK